MESRFIILLLIPRVVYCLDLEASDEQTFPNGTLVGTYSYVDTRGNKVQVKYFADRKSYGVYLKGTKMPEDEKQNSKSRSETTELATSILDKMVPLKVNLPVIDNIYTIENKHNYTYDEEEEGKNITKRLESDVRESDYAPVHTSKRKSYMKGKKRGYNFIRKIRQALELYSRKML